MVESVDPARIEVVLASSSPRRHELLTQLGVRFRAVAPNVDEAALAGEEPGDYVARIAADKAAAVPGADTTLVIAADTTVDVDGRILAKPVDRDDARSMLRMLSGRDHQVHTGVAVRRGEVQRVTVVTTTVRFVDLDPATIDWYVHHEDVLDKAGAYAIQGAGGALVEAVTGSVSNVVGLPLAEVVRLARDLGVTLVGGRADGSAPPSR